ncbi:MAG: sugar transferase [Patescibacteria group bacterium]
MKEIRKLTLFLGDVAMLYASLALTLVIRYPMADLELHLKNHLYPFSAIFILWLAVFYLSELYQYKNYGSASMLVKRLAGAVFLSGVSSVIIFYLFGNFFELTPKINLLIFSGIFLALDYSLRILIAKAFTAGAAKIMVLGDAPLLKEIEKYLAGNPHAGYQVADTLKNPGENSAETIAREIRDKKISAVIFQPNAKSDFSNLKTIFQLLSAEVDLINAWDFYEMLFEKVPLKDLDENWFIEKISTRRPFYDGLKRIVDILLSLVLGIIFLPFGIIFALGIRITSAGPAIFKQERMGRNSRTFTLYKFRTMRNGDKGPLWTEENDGRITAFGKFLRFTHLDETPQLWNILRGDISFTGPRPERAELAETFRKFPYYDIRHIVKPGLSGWAQINYKPSASLEEAYEKLRYDIYYVKNRSFFLDFVIILKTIRYVFTPHH